VVGTAIEPITPTSSPVVLYKQHLQSFCDIDPEASLLSVYLNTKISCSLMAGYAQTFFIPIIHLSRSLALMHAAQRVYGGIVGNK
jgi:hypothetical protein